MTCIKSSIKLTRLLIGPIPITVAYDDFVFFYLDLDLGLGLGMTSSSV